MVNNDRIVPIQKIDLLTMYGTILRFVETPTSVLESTDVLGDFSVTGSEEVGNVLANQPVRTLDFANGVSTATVFFVAGYDFSGFTVNGVSVTPIGDTVNPDGVTLYRAELSGGDVDIVQLTPSLASATNGKL